jgi:sulfatase maturation enzyme AslB (radical SAM superfamily)
MGHYRKQAITILVSGHCNLNCIYCYIPKRGQLESRATKIDLDFVEAGIKEYFAKTGFFSIRFFSSGEATCEFEQLKTIAELANKIAGRKVQIELQTNGFFNDNIADWVEKNVDILWISYDGPPEVSDKQRPTLTGGPSSPVILNNILRFVKNSKIQFGVRATFLPENFNKQIDIIEYFYNIGIKWVCGAPSYSSPVNEVTTIPHLIQFASGFVPAFYRAQVLGMFYQTHLIIILMKKLHVIVVHAQLRLLLS